MVEKHRKGRWKGSEYFHEADYVLATDYATLEAERDEWKRRCEKMVKYVSGCNSVAGRASDAICQSIAEGRDNA